MILQSLITRLTQRNKKIEKPTHSIYGWQTRRKETNQYGGKHLLSNTFRNDYRMETGGKQK